MSSSLFQVTDHSSVPQQYLAALGDRSQFLQLTRRFNQRISSSRSYLPTPMELTPVWSYYTRRFHRKWIPAVTLAEVYGDRWPVPSAGPCPALDVHIAAVQKMPVHDKAAYRLHLNRCPRCGLIVHVLRQFRHRPTLRTEAIALLEKHFPERSIVSPRKIEVA